ncbi:TetR/AcrR family transcriptional regulator [Paraburkholderia sp. J11-2]|uniref:TetR/AcrR family transcriptional regulator n=1 Tax=Paraburkholderia sp. J11-2 TaxID=2805431 RepID=UPI002AB7229E|nr:TetR/AcrR family transcriptional regulator [Paraburkholderia sp. J11-2]
MARPLSPEKRNALLVAATQAVAEQGVLASTASIARRAGVAEGTLFTYFENKDVLFQELYLHLKHELAETIMPGYPSEAGFQLRLEHVFQHYVRWGVANTAGRLAIARLSASGQLWDETRTQGMEPFMAVSQMMEEAVQRGVLLDAPIAFLYSIIERIADTTIEFVERQPDDAERHRQLGFHAAWRAITP